MKEIKNKKWNQTKTNDSWSIFKIMGEFVEGYEKLGAIGPCISIFGSARTKPDHKYYKLAEEIAAEIVGRGYGVITGGGPGIMEAANKGANRGKGDSVGLCIDLPFEKSNNEYIDKDKKLIFDYFFVRKVIFEALTLIQTSKSEKFPIILVGSEFWDGMIDWIKKTLLLENKNIYKKDLDLLKIADTKDEVINILEEFHNNYDFSPNF